MIGPGNFIKGGLSRLSDVIGEAIDSRRLNPDGLKITIVPGSIDDVSLEARRADGVPANIDVPLVPLRIDVLRRRHIYCAVRGSGRRFWGIVNLDLIEDQRMLCRVRH